MLTKLFKLGIHQVSSEACCPALCESNSRRRGNRCTGNSLLPPTWLLCYREQFVAANLAPVLSLPATAVRQRCCQAGLRQTWRAGIQPGQAAHGSGGLQGPLPDVGSLNTRGSNCPSAPAHYPCEQGGRAAPAALPAERAARGGAGAGAADSAEHARAKPHQRQLSGGGGVPGGAGAFVQPVVMLMDKASWLSHDGVTRLAAQAARRR